MHKIRLVYARFDFIYMYKIDYIHNHFVRMCIYMYK